jgi:nicotinate-nucleotide adenylyltransferase
LGVLGGTFDPVHYGHLRIAGAALQSLQLDGVLFIPTANPPHKNQSTVASFRHRLAMLSLALLPEPAFAVSTLEGERPGFSYTIETLSTLKSGVARHGRLYFLLGMDAFLEIGTWKNYDRLLDHADLVLFAREELGLDRAAEVIAARFPGFHSVAAENLWRSAGAGGMIHALTAAPIPVSSTAVRELIRAGSPLTGLTPVSVAAYIEGNGLYRSR